MKHEVIERKGIGHPDTIADELSECLGMLLKDEYAKEEGKVLHYNVDKVLVGSGKVNYAAGKMVKPVNIVFAGQYTKIVSFEVEKLMAKTVDLVLEQELFSDLQVIIHNMLTDGSPDLSSNFTRRKCNDTSFGVGNPYTKNERLVLRLGKYLDNLWIKYAWAGRDNKVMFVDGKVTIAFAFKMPNNARMLYFEKKELLRKLIEKKFGIDADINVADTPTSFFATLTGTSLEQGDAGMTGRGNRYNGLITPLRFMTLEAYYGKNDVTHIGRIYQKKAQQIAEKTRKSVLLVNQIGKNVNKPTIIFK